MHRRSPQTVTRTRLAPSSFALRSLDSAADRNAYRVAVQHIREQQVRPLRGEFPVSDNPGVMSAKVEEFDLNAIGALPFLEEAGQRRARFPGAKQIGGPGRR